MANTKLTPIPPHITVTKLPPGPRTEDGMTWEQWGDGHLPEGFIGRPRFNKKGAVTSTNLPATGYDPEDCMAIAAIESALQDLSVAPWDTPTYRDALLFFTCPDSNWHWMKGALHELDPDHVELYARRLHEHRTLIEQARAVQRARTRAEGKREDEKAERRSRTGWKPIPLRQLQHDTHKVDGDRIVH